MCVCVKINEVKWPTKPRTVLTITRPSCMDISDFYIFLYVSEDQEGEMLNLRPVCVWAVTISCYYILTCLLNMMNPI